MNELIKHVKVLENEKLVERDILIEAGKIRKIAPIITGKGISAKGLIAIPGLIDAHVHTREPGGEKKEDYHTCSMAAAAGGVTSFISMPNTSPPTISLSSLDNVRNLAKKSIVDYGFHMGGTDSNINEIKNARNIASVKLYLGHSTGNLMIDNPSEILKNAKRVVIHSEDQALIDKNKERFKGRDDPEVHSLIRSKEASLSALKKVLALRRSAHIHVAHASSAEEIFLAKAHKNTSVEITPHHLFLSEKDYSSLGTKIKVNPPVRSPKEVSLLWKNLDKADIIATDHAPHLMIEKDKDYRSAPAGVPGIQTMLPLLLNAVNDKRLSLKRLIELTSNNPAGIFGIAGKGHLKEGYDADIVLIDMKKEHILKNDDQLSKCGWTPYDRWVVKGKAMLTMLRGTIIYEEGIVTDNNKGKELIFN